MYIFKEFWLKTVVVLIIISMSGSLESGQQLRNNCRWGREQFGAHYEISDSAWEPALVLVMSDIITRLIVPKILKVSSYS